jgi:hypothetical protein
MYTTSMSCSCCNPFWGPSTNTTRIFFLILLEMFLPWLNHMAPNNNSGNLSNVCKWCELYHHIKIHFGVADPSF